VQAIEERRWLVAVFQNRISCPVLGKDERPALLARRRQTKKLLHSMITPCTCQQSSQAIRFRGEFGRLFFLSICGKVMERFGK
jgi:hypothetical protein